MKIQVVKITSVAIACAIFAASGFAAAATGDADPEFIGSIPIAPWNAVAALPDGKFLCLGSQLVRYDRHGNLDPTFVCEATFSALKMEVLQDGRILVGGIFEFRGQTQSGILRLSKDGKVDESFSMTRFDSILSFAVHPDGGLIVGGSRIDGGVIRKLSRFRADGTQILTFSPVLNNNCLAIAVQADGKILIAGSFTTVDGVSRVNFARLQADGSNDATFRADCGGGVSAWVFETPERQILLGGNFTSINGSPAVRVARVDQSGTLDPAFSFPAAATPGAGLMSLQADGKVLLAGGNAIGLSRLNPNGSIDATLEKTYGRSPDALALEARGKVIVSGKRTNSNSTSYLERYLNDPGSSSIAVLPGGQIRWERSGSLPEVNAPLMEVSMEGGAWGVPVPGQRVAGQWVFDAAMPANGVVRVSGRTFNVDGPSWVNSYLNLGSAAPVISVKLVNGLSIENGNEISFPPAFPNSSRIIRFEIENTGDGVLENLDAVLSGADAGDFEVALVPSDQLDPGGSTSVIVAFKATTVGSRSANLEIRSSDPSLPSLNVNLAATTSTEMSPVFRSVDDVIHATGTGFDGSLYTFGGLNLDFVPEAESVLSLVKSSSGPVTPISDLALGSIVTTTFQDVTYRFLAGQRGNELLLTLIGDGTLLSSFDTETEEVVRSIAVSPSGRTYALFLNKLSQKHRVLRFNQDGRRDPVFSIEIPVFAPLLLQPDGKILIGRIRYHDDGSVDASYAPDPSKFSTAIAIQPDGKILAAIIAIPTSSGRSLTRLNSDGSADTSFSGGIPMAIDDEVKVLKDGRILLCRSGGSMLRINPDGSIENSSGFPYFVARAAVQADGKILVILSDSGSLGTPTRLKRLNADGSTDESFHEAVLDYQVQPSSIYGCAIQGDGKIIICGNFTSIGGVERLNVARLLPDGRLDTGFRCDVSTSVGSVVILDDGTAMLGGSFTNVSGMPSGGISLIRAGTSVSEALIQDGQTIRWDRSGTAPPLHKVRVESLAGNAGAWSPLGEAQAVVGGWEFSPGSLPTDTLFRLYGDTLASTPGSVQPGILVSQGNVAPDLGVLRGNESIPSGTGVHQFGDVVMGFDKEVILEVVNSGTDRLQNIVCSLTGPNASDFTITARSATELWPLEKHVLSIRFKPGLIGERNAILQIESDDPDTRTYSVSLRGIGSNFISPVFASPQEILFSVPTFDTSGLSFGQLSLGFAPGPGTVLTVVNNTGSDPIVGTFPDLENASLVTADFGGVIYEFLVSYRGGDGNDLTLRFNQPGVINTAFKGNTGNTGYGMAIQPDGKILVGDGGATVDGVFRSRILRFHPDGSVDNSFQAATNQRAESIALQLDGKAVIAGGFTEVEGVPRNYVARLLPDGRLDVGFDPQVNSIVYRALVLRSGKILIGGSFSMVGATFVTCLARLNPDGSLDPTFQCEILPSGSQPVIYAMAEQDDGKLWVGGVFAKVNGITRSGLVKLDVNGALDTSFNASLSSVSSIAIQPDGKVLVGGSFTSVTAGSSVSRTRVARFNADGTLDAFNPVANNSVVAISVQTDGKILLGGLFTTMGGVTRNYIARVFENGSLDTGFVSGAGGGVYNVLLNGNGDVLIAGSFSLVSGVPSLVSGVPVTGIAMLQNDPGEDVLELDSPDRVHWSRSGALPSLTSVEFEVSEDSGASWVNLGAGVREVDGWSLGSLSLPASGHLRAVGRIIVSNRGSGFIRRHLLFGRAPSPIENWREAAFRFPFNEGDGANDKDTDSDGTANLLEYAFGLSARDPASHHLPAWTVEGESHVLSFMTPAGVHGVGVSAEWSETMRDDDWHPATDESVGDMKVFRIQRGNDPAKFFRLKAMQE